MDKVADSKVWELIAETLIEIRDEMRRNRPPVLDVQSHPERVRRLKDMRPPGEPYRPVQPQLADLVPMTK
jgi:hypothetical protein